ncbi:lipoprotein, putative [Synechococcus sp. JA-2-3B'a(2-13)]|nr:lipoprotein, putative [Synechococcus sp. JA-2-3B'a(2-13)]
MGARFCPDGRLYFWLSLGLVSCRGRFLGFFGVVMLLVDPYKQPYLW